MSKVERFNLHLAYLSLLVFSVGIFTSVSISAVGHILLFIPGLYFTFRDFKELKENMSASFICLTLLTLASLISVGMNLDIMEKPLSHLFKTKYFIFGLLGFMAYRALFKKYLNDKKKKLLLHLFLISTTLATISGVLALYTGFNILKFKEACHPTRACGVYGMYMTYGYGISLFCMLLTGMLIKAGRIKDLISRRFIFICLAINLVGLFLSYTRGGLIGYLFALPFFFLRNHKKLFFSLIGIGTITLGSLIVISPKARDAFFNRSESNNRRLQFYEAALIAFKERPLFGYGYKNFEPHVKRIKTENGIENAHLAGHGHNNFIEHMASTGIFGLVFFALFVFFWAKEMYYRNDIWGKSIFPFIISFLISGMFQYTFGDGENLFLIMGVYSLSQLLLHARPSYEKESWFSSPTPNTKELI